MEFSEALGVDVGSKRIGIARVGSVARLPEPVTTVDGGDQATEDIFKIAQELGSDAVVVGLPRNLSGEDTQQTLFSRQFADKLKSLGLNVVMQDEALTSKHADELIAQGVYRRNMRGDDVTTDEVAACLILQDFIGEAR